MKIDRLISSYYLNEKDVYALFDKSIVPRLSRIHWQSTTVVSQLISAVKNPPGHNSYVDPDEVISYLYDRKDLEEDVLNSLYVYFNLGKANILEKWMKLTLPEKLSYFVSRGVSLNIWSYLKDRDLIALIRHCVAYKGPR